MTPRRVALTATACTALGVLAALAAVAVVIGEHSRQADIDAATTPCWPHPLRNT